MFPFRLLWLGCSHRLLTGSSLPRPPWEGHLLSRVAFLITVAKPTVSLQLVVSTSCLPICLNRSDTEKLKWLSLDPLTFYSLVTQW